MKSEINYLLKESEKLKLAGQHDEAIKLCEQALIKDLECIEAYEEIGDNYLSLHKFSKAKKALKKAIDLCPRSANANYLIGFLHSAAGNYKKSVDYLENSDKFEPNHPEILRCLGWSIFHNGEKERGIILLERALTLTPQDPLILSDLGVCYLNKKDFDRASGLFKRILEIEPNNEKARECLNAVRFFKHEYKKIKESSARNKKK